MPKIDYSINKKQGRNDIGVLIKAYYNEEELKLNPNQLTFRLCWLADLTVPGTINKTITYNSWTAFKTEENILLDLKYVLECMKIEVARAKNWQAIDKSGVLDEKISTELIGDAVPGLDDPTIRGRSLEL